MTELDLAHDEGAGLGNLREYSVGELSQALRRTVEGAFVRVRVRGEITGAKRHGSGHFYFTLKDEDAVLEAVCWRTVAARLAIVPKDGLEVVCTGKLSTYAARSKYQIVIESIEPAGEGALMALLAARRRALEREGLFDSARKRPLPYLPEVIGVVTSPSGAVIRDILHRLADRFPRHVLMWPVAVQGEDAAGQIAAAIEGFGRLKASGPLPRPDVLIVARGGGSIEDLWAFNDEAVVRAAAASPIPLISAVGHETDTTLIDFAADVRAPTPSAAAEMAVPVRAELSLAVLDGERRLGAAINRRLEAARLELTAAARGLRSPAELLEMAVQRLDDLAEGLGRALKQGLADKGHRLERAGAGLRPGELTRELRRKAERAGEHGRALRQAMARRLRDMRTALAAQANLLVSLSYERVLERGYVVVRERGARPITSARALQAGMALDLDFHDGTAAATVAGRRRARRAPGAETAAERQGKLL